MGLTDYKAKYMDLKIKYLNTRDLTWRLGYEQGLKDAQTDQAQQQAQAAAMPQQGEEQPSEEAPQGSQEETPVSNTPNEDELGQHIEKLESMLGKSEISNIDLQDLKKTLSDIRSLQTQTTLTKSMESIKNTKLDAGHKHSFSLSPKNKVNLPEPAKKALSLQEKIVGDVFAKWEKDSSSAVSDISSIIKMDGLTKKD